ncbi:MAG: transposase [Sphingobacteriales bacterium]|nr:transposase [Sphingobacteriales bacterium]
MVLKSPGNDIWYEDECHFQQHGTRCRMWVPPEEEDPIIQHAPTRKVWLCSELYQPLRDNWLQWMQPYLMPKPFIVFKESFEIKKRGKKTILILDNARYHHAIMIQPWLNKNKGKIQLLFLPPYSRI